MLPWQTCLPHNVYLVYHLSLDRLYLQSIKKQRSLKKKVIFSGHIDATAFKLRTEKNVRHSDGNVTF